MIIKKKQKEKKKQQITDIIIKVYQKNFHF